MSKQPVKKDVKSKKKELGLYSKALLNRKISISFNFLGKNIKENLEKIVKKESEGKCIKEGYIKKDSTNIISYSSGLLKENLIYFDVVFECLICNPVEGMNIKCKSKNITQAGIRAVSLDDPSPVVIYISRDHHINNNYFNNVKEDEEINIRVIGQRFELNDKEISIVGELIEPKDRKKKTTTKKTKLVIKEN